MLNIIMRKVANLYGGDRSISPDDWAANVMSHLYADNVNTTFVRELASYYLTHLLVACKGAVQYSIILVARSN